VLSADIVLALAELAETATGDFTVDELLHELCTLAARALDIHGAGVMIADRDSIRFIHATPKRVVDVETLQEVLQRGPCRTSMEDGAAVVVDDITRSHRWPEFTDASAVAGLRAVVAMPLMARNQAWGALDVYRNTEWSWNDDEIALVRLFAGVAASYLVMAADRDLASAARRDLEHEATHDDLTGLPGRRLLFTLLEHAIVSARRRETVVAVLFVDLDHFKAVNDTLGHAGGDAVLVETATRLSRAMRDTDMVARLAGDEFVIVCEDLPRDKTVVHRHLEALGHRLRGVLSRPMDVAGEEVVVSASIGVAVSSPVASPADLLAGADAAMYAAKRRGRGRLMMGARGSDTGFNARHRMQLPEVPGGGHLRALTNGLGESGSRDREAG
jgi:diguanylate cyclase (GGDEF)-like protein